MAWVSSTNPNAGEGTTVNVKFTPNADVPLDAKIILGFPLHFGVRPETVSFTRGLTRRLAIGRLFPTAAEANAELLDASADGGGGGSGSGGGGGGEEDGEGDEAGSSKRDDAEDEGEDAAGWVVEVIVDAAASAAEGGEGEATDDDDDAAEVEAEAEAAAAAADADDAEAKEGGGSSPRASSSASSKEAEDAAEARALAKANRTRLAAAGTPVSFTLNGVTNPGWSGNPKDFGFFSLRLIDAAGRTLQLAQRIAPWAINPGELGVPSVTIAGSTTAIAGSTNPATVTFTTTNAVPISGAVTIAFPLGFELPRGMAIAEAEGFAVDETDLGLKMRGGRVIVYSRTGLNEAAAAVSGEGGDDAPAGFSGDGGGSESTKGGEEGDDDDDAFRSSHAEPEDTQQQRLCLIDAATQVRILFDRVTLPSTAGTRDSRGDERTYSIATSASTVSGVVGDGSVIDEAGIVPASKLIVTVKLDALMRFVFPARWQHHREMALLTVFALYGPLDEEGNLRSGARRKHVMTRREIVWLLDEVEREDLIDAIIGPGRASGLSGSEKAEILKTAEINAVQARLRSYTKEEVRGLFAHEDRAADGGLSFHHMQQIVTEERAARILRAFHPMPAVTSGKRAFKRRIHPKALPSNLHDMESTQRTAKLQHKNTFQISEFGARNGVGCNVPLLRSSARPKLQKGDVGWRTAYATTVERPLALRKERSKARRRAQRK